jgi:DNA-binding CsgD family transcriptional regulator
VSLSPPVPEFDPLDALSADALSVLEAVAVPAYIVDRQRRVRWQNAASIEVFGDVRGRLDGSVGLDNGDLTRAREAWAQKLNGASHAELDVSVSRADGTRIRATLSTVPLKDAEGRMTGSFGLAHVVDELDPVLGTPPSLSPRERETLTLLAAGCSTAQMAQRMNISKETVRNHVKGVLRCLNARSRVEAVAKAHRLGLI